MSLLSSTLFFLFLRVVIDLTLCALSEKSFSICSPTGDPTKLGLSKCASPQMSMLLRNDNSTHTSAKLQSWSRIEQRIKDERANDQKCGRAALNFFTNERPNPTHDNYNYNNEQGYYSVPSTVELSSYPSKETRWQ